MIHNGFSEEEDPRPKERVYDAEVYPLMEEVIRICKENDIRCIVTFELDERGEDGPLHCTTALMQEAPGRNPGLDELFALLNRQRVAR